MKVKWFKKELESSLHQSSMRKSLNEKIEMLQSQFEPHSKSWDSLHYATQESDEKLANYIDKKKELEKEIEVLDYQKARVDKIMSYLPTWIRIDIIHIYTSKVTYENLAIAMNASKTYIKKMFDSELLKAIESYENDI